MRRADSFLFAPYRSMGVVCSDVKPVIRKNNSRIRMTSVFCPVGNFILHYKAENLRLVGVSDILPDIVTAVAADHSGVYAATSTVVAFMKTCRHVDRYIDVEANIKFMNVLGDFLIIVDAENAVRVFDVADGQKLLFLDGSVKFVITAVLHPSTYLYKILVGSSTGTLRLINFRTGRIIYEFSKGFDAAITVLEQSPAIDVVAVGLFSGQIVLHNLRVDETVCKFRHEKAISAIGFRDDGEPYMISADIGGDIAVWNLEKRQLIGKISNVHSAAVTELYFMPEEPIMVSASADNSLRTWVFDGADGMPRQLVILEGHANDVTSVQFTSKEEVLSSGMDGSVRKYMVNVETMRQKLGSSGTMPRATAKKRRIPLESIGMPPVIEITFGWSREAAWDNVLCRHQNTLFVTTWTTRRNAQGTHRLVHERFLKDTTLLSTIATAIALSPCGNFAFIGYSSGHVDQFNVQSGRFITTFNEQRISDNDSGTTAGSEVIHRAHDSKITALTVDTRCSELVTGCYNGCLKFWQLRSGKLLATMRTRLRIECSKSCTVNSLMALLCTGGEGPSIAVIDLLCRRVVRKINSVGNRVNALGFSSDGRWLLTADDYKYIRVWELATAQLIDVILFDKPCIGLSFNTSGEYLATIHKEERGIFIWVNKKMYASHVNIRALPVDFTPTWNSYTPEIGVNTFVIDDESDDEWEGKTQIHESLVTYSGLAPSRWANLPILTLIKERNKPHQPARKPKQAPFFLTAVPTLEGFEFEVPQEESDEQRRILQAKRSLLELESSFSSSLRKASSAEELHNVFTLLKKMSVSAIDFQIRTLPVDLLPKFFLMLTEVLKGRRDFELVQAYLATSIRIHRSSLWYGHEDKTENGDELSNVLQDLYMEITHAWSNYDEIMVENAAVAQWIKNALI
ncbi:Utp21 specific WD40 associated domain protein [Dictyocaulus viviparus]|uniref:Utp21 specific WD40 associated domain protein n=1 Tax=Dictyocaulus viviparus TaxID=29172 RepID=A0A0D8Y6D8_DICVI|nr:Utp21 specific WD40 associated domain protein [Dictyocaulus viviparus]